MELLLLLQKIRMNGSYYNYTTSAYYCDNENEEPNHQIAIIGWDDTYSRYNFNSSHRPSSNGAYIALNSWGETFGDNGVYYISYEDTNIEGFVLGIKKVTDIDYDHIYQHDPLGIDTSIPVPANVVYGANVFAKESNRVEKITQISISNLTAMSCDIYINAESGELNPAKLKKVNNSIITLEPGYTTIKLDNPVEIKGNKFAIVVKYISNDGVVRIGVEGPVNGLDGYWDTAKSNPGESYLADNLDKFYDLAVDFPYLKNANLCIKAFTQEIESDIISNKYEIDEEKGIIKIMPNIRLNEFTGNVTVNGTMNVYQENDNILANSSFLGTGMKAKITRNGKTNTYTIIVKGDISGDGMVTLQDLSSTLQAYMKNITLSENSLLAVDFSLDGEITLQDFSTELQYMYEYL